MDQRSTTESTEIHGKENPNQLPLSVSFPEATPARRVGSFRGYPLVTIFLAGVRAVPTRSPNGGRKPPFSHDQTLDTVLDVEHLTLPHRDLSSPRNPASRGQRLFLGLQTQILPLQN